MPERNSFWDFGDLNPFDKRFWGFQDNGKFGFGAAAKADKARPGSGGAPIMNFARNSGRTAIERASKGTMVGPSSSSRSTNYFNRGQVAAPVAGPFKSGYRGGKDLSSSHSMGPASNIMEDFGAVFGGGPGIPPPPAPSFIDARAQARAEADAYINAQLKAIDKAKGNTQSLYNTNSGQISTMYKGLSDDIADDQSLINTTYGDALKSVDQSYAQGRESVQDTEAQSLARREALARRLGTQEGTGELAKDVSDDAAAQVALLANNETAMEDFLTEGKVATTNQNTQNAQNAIRAGNAAKSDLTAQLQQILGQLNVRGVEAQGQGEQMFQQAFGNYSSQNAKLAQDYENQLYQRQMDEYGLEQDFFDRQFRVQQQGLDNSFRERQFAQQSMPEQEAPAVSGLQSTVNYLGSKMPPQKAQQLTQVAYAALQDPSTKSDAAQLARVMRQSAPRGFTDLEIQDAASWVYQQEKLRGASAIEALLGGGR